MFNKFPIHFTYDGVQYRGEIQPLQTGLQHRIPTAFQVILNNVYCGLVRRKGADWETDSPKCAIMVEVIGNHISGTSRFIITVRPIRRSTRLLEA